MAMHPEAQAAGQSEIDRVIGNRRMPTMADRPSLPYIEAIVKEVFRWGPPAPGGIVLTTYFLPEFRLMEH